MRILVTGAGGRIGPFVVSFLMEAGYDTVVLLRGSAPPKLHFSEVRRGDLCNPADAFTVLRGIDAVIHLAAIAAPGYHPDSELFRNNVLSTYNLLEAAEAHGASRIVFASSIAALGYTYAPVNIAAVFPIRQFPIDETQALRPADPYALSKVVGESTCDTFCRRGHMSIASLRFSWITSHCDISAITSKATNSNSFIRTLWSYIDVHDVAQAIRQALVASFAGHLPIYLTAPDTLSTLPTISLIREKFPDVPRFDEKLAGFRSVFDCQKAREVLSYVPHRSWREYA